MTDIAVVNLVRPRLIWLDSAAIGSAMGVSNPPPRALGEPNPPCSYAGAWIAWPPTPSEVHE